MCVAFLIEAVLIIGGNLLVIAFFALEKKHRKKSVCSRVVRSCVSAFVHLFMNRTSSLFGDQMHIEMSLRVFVASVIQF